MFLCRLATEWGSGVKVDIPWSGLCGVWAVDGAAMLVAAMYIGDIRVERRNS